MPELEIREFRLHRKRKLQKRDRQKNLQTGRTKASTAEAISKSERQKQAGKWQVSALNQKLKLDILLMNNCVK